MIKFYKPKKLQTKKFNLNKQKSRITRGYDSKWYAFRTRFIKHNPKCYACGSNDRINVDHIIAHKSDEKLFWNAHNYIPLCHSCHSYVTAKFDRFDEPKTEQKIKWLQETRKQLQVDTKVVIVPI